MFFLSSHVLTVPITLKVLLIGNKNKSMVTQTFNKLLKYKKIFLKLNRTSMRILHTIKGLNKYKIVELRQWRGVETMNEMELKYFIVFIFYDSKRGYCELWFVNLQINENLFLKLHYKFIESLKLCLSPKYQKLSAKS